MAASSPSSSSKRKITLKTSDDQSFEVDEDIATQSQTIKNMFDEISSANLIPLPNLKSNVLSRVIEYCTKKHDASESSSTLISDDAKEYKSDFSKELKDNHDLLFDLILGKTPQQIRDTFHIVNNYTPEEEEEIKKELALAFE
ncbi:SKP1-like protein 4 [Bienertia sinuspersici]